MASFTDQIMQFNPYVPQLPVEAMVKVGMYKQQKYEEGVQKIQDQIDFVAGLDIIKPVHRKYLQSKLDELGNNLRTVAAGDFSNFQLVNSVAGMVKQVTKDPIVQVGVSNTQKVRKQQERKETAIKAGKSGIQNDEYFDYELNNWLSDNDLTSSYLGKYTDYIDQEKKLREVAEKVHEYDHSIEVPFRRDNQGNVLYYSKDKSGKEIVSTNPATGQPKIDEAILKTKVKGKSAQKILDNFYTSLDPNDMEQLKIDGWWHYRNVAPQDFKNRIREDIVSNYTAKKKMASDEVVRLSVELSSNTKLTAGERDVIQSQINRYMAASKKDGDLDKRMEEELNNIDKTSDIGLKQSVYTEKFLSRLANNIAYEDLQIEYKENPYFNAEMKKKDLEFKYWNASREQRNSDRDYALSIFKLRKENEPKNLIWEDVGIETGGAAPKLSDLSNGINALNSQMEDFMTLNGGMLIANYESMNPEQRRKALHDKLERYRRNPSEIKDNRERKLMSQYDALTTDMNRRIGNYMQINELLKPYDERIANLTAGEAPVIDQRGVRHSAKNIVNLMNDVDNLVIMNKKWSVAEKAYVYSVNPLPALEKYKGTQYESIVNAYVKRAQGGSLDAASTSVLQNAENLQKKYLKQSRLIYDEKQAKGTELISKSMPQYQMSVAALDMDDKSINQQVEIALTAMNAVYNRLGSLGSDKYDPDVINDWRSGKEKLNYYIKKSADNSGGFLVVSKGTQTQEVPLTGDQLRKYFPKSVEGNRLDGLKFLVMGSPNMTTNIRGVTKGGPEGAINAAFTGDQLPLLAGTPLAPLIRFDVEGDSENTGGENDLFQVRMYVNDNGVWKDRVLNEEGYVKLGGVDEILRNVGTKTFEQVKSQR